ncbi:response regulator transcription factor [Cellulosimicrobium cellulans]|uniref:response regulator transcription factor n=1 Tax=Cellulosimicrobium cellulans TaxID=1710 RepID=UPI00344DD50C
MIAEDSALLREGLRALLVDEGVEVVAVAADADELLESLEREGCPDVVITDVRMPPTHTDEGLRAALEIRRRWPATGVLVLSQHVETQHTARLVDHDGAGTGYLLKDRVMVVDELLTALDRVAAGDHVVDPEVVRRLLNHARRTAPLERLTPREREVLERMARGLTNAGIGAALHLSQSAVEKHVNAIFAKLDLPTTREYSRRLLAVLRYLDGTSSDAGRPRTSS